MEIKSGYGLSLEHEVKMLEVIDALKGKPVDIVATFMGAHAVPREYKDNPKAYVDLVVEEMIPTLLLRDWPDIVTYFAKKASFPLTMPGGFYWRQGNAVWA